MTLLSRNQRAIIVADTSIHPLIVDRATEAFDALIDRGDVQAYKQYMATAWSQMGFSLDNPITDKDRPTALDVVKTICLKSYADKQRITFKEAVRRLERMLEG